MLAPVSCFLAIFAFIILDNNRTYSYKTLEDLKTRFKKLENEEFSSSDVLVGKVMDFIYSNKTMMGLLAGELWNVGSRAIDNIVEVKTKLKTGPGLLPAKQQFKAQGQ